MPPNIYATIADLEAFGIAADALAAIEPEKKNAVLSSVSRMMDGYFGAQFQLPIVSWGDDVRTVCCQIAAYRILAVRGFNPDGSDQVIRDNHDDGMKLLREWASDRGAVPDVKDSSSNAEQEHADRPSMTSSPSRGWTSAGLAGSRAGMRVPFGGG